jgi:hypothetical protein
MMPAPFALGDGFGFLFDLPGAVAHFLLRTTRHSSDSRSLPHYHFLRSHITFSPKMLYSLHDILLFTATGAGSAFIRG